MPFPSTSGSKIALERAWASLMASAGRIKGKAQSLRDASLQPTRGTLILSVMDDLLASQAAMQAMANTPGLEAYARAQISDPTLDLVAAFNAVIGNVNAVRDWVVANIPKDANNYLLLQTISASGARIDREFSSLTLSGLRTVLDTLIASID